jgi:hypothetical protein
MSRWADWFPVTLDEAEQLLTATRKGDAAVIKLLQPWLDNLEELPLRVDIDKAWEPIHLCLTDAEGVGEYPLNLCVKGGTRLLKKGYRTAALIPASDVPPVSVALTGVRKRWFRDRFFNLPDTQSHEINEEEFESVWECFRALPPFFRKAAAGGQAVICTISH